MIIKHKKIGILMQRQRKYIKDKGTQSKDRNRLLENTELFKLPVF